MKVKLITKTQNLLDVLYTSATTCYNSGSPIDKWFDVCTIPTDKKQKLIDKCIKSGHTSVLEHSQFTFAVEGISKASSVQLLRHRHCSFSQQSQRYVEIKESQNELEKLFTDNYTPETYKNSGLYKILDKYFVDADKFKNINGYYYALDNYLEAINNGEKAEDARRFLPNATKTNLVVTMNLREFIHICSLRLCSKSQLEIRHLIKEMKNEVIKEFPWLEDYLQPKCISMGKCNEQKPCGYFDNFK